jgi:hypothetical protein
MGDKKMLTAKEFSEQTGISYPVVIEWLRAQQEPGAEQKLPGAGQIEIGKMRAWQIPASLVARFSKPENKPRKGRPPKTGQSATAVKAVAKKTTKK